MLRLMDILFAITGLFFGTPIFVAIYLVGLFDTGSPLFRQVRVGRNQIPFFILKFRTMQPGTPDMASHLAESSSITSFGMFLRRTKIDELPQLWNVLKGEMSLVGPRPCLFNQHELIAKRNFLGVFEARPGITGLAQVNKVDMSTPELLAKTDADMLKRLTPAMYLKYVFMTVSGKGLGDGVRKIW